MRYFFRQLLFLSFHTLKSILKFRGLAYQSFSSKPAWQAFESEGSSRRERKARPGARQEGGKETPARKPLFRYPAYYL